MATSDRSIRSGVRDRCVGGAPRCTQSREPGADRGRRAGYRRDRSGGWTADACPRGGGGWLELSARNRRAERTGTAARCAVPRDNTVLIQQARRAGVPGNIVVARPVAIAALLDKEYGVLLRWHRTGGKRTGSSVRFHRRLNSQGIAMDRSLAHPASVSVLRPLGRLRWGSIYARSGPRTPFGRPPMGLAYRRSNSLRRSSK